MTNLENNNSNSFLEDSAVDLKELFSILRKGKIPIIVITFVFFILVAAVFSFITLFKSGLKLDRFFFNNDNYRNASYYWMIPIGIILFAISLSSITSSGFNPFIYFRF